MDVYVNKIVHMYLQGSPSVCVSRYEKASLINSRNKYSTDRLFFRHINVFSHFSDE